VFAQQTGAPNQWNGLTLDQSTTEDAIRLFGEPEKDKNKQSLEILRATSWLSGKQDEKIYRSLSYKNLKGFDYVKLSFLEDKLILINLESANGLKKSVWLDPDDLAEIFGIEFKPYARKYGRTRPTPTEFKTNAPSELKEGEYNFWYDLMAVGDESFIIAIANNDKNLIGGAVNPNDPTDLKIEDRKKEINSKGKYPGFVERIQIISRRIAAQ
jgi:hypothetical protein